MLPPEYLDFALDDILELYNKLDETIINDIVRRIVKTGNISATADWQIQRIQHSGLLYKDIIKRVSELTNASEQQIAALFEDAAVESIEWDNEIYEAAGLSPPALRQSPESVRILNASIEKTAGHLQNLTMTTAVTSQQAYINVSTLAEMQIESGAFDYVTAIKNAVRTAVESGAEVLYPSGHRDKLDVAARRAALTGVSQTVGKISEQYADDMGCDLMEITAHAGARPDHAVWQGKLVSRKGRKGYLSLSDIGYGTGAGFKGWNCRHDWFPFFEGISESAYPRAKLREYEEKKVVYNDKEIPYYDATQLQRRMEREIRQTKRALSAYDTGIKASDDEKMKNAFREDFNAASVKLKRQESALKDFAKQTGIDRKGNREQVLGFNRSVSSKAVQANKKVEIQRRNAIIESEIKSATKLRGELSISPVKLDTSVLSFDSAHINKERSHNITESEAKQFIEEAKVSLTRWNGKFVNYYSTKGAAYVDVESNSIRTAFGESEFDEKTKLLMEELKKRGK